MNNTPLQRILTRRKHLMAEGQRVAIPSLWHDAAAGGAGLLPGDRLAVLAAHRPDPKISWLDHMGYRLAALLSHWHRPLRQLRLRSRIILSLADKHRSLNDEALQGHLRQLAAACRMEREGPGGGGGTLATQEQHRGLAGVVLAVERVYGFTPHLEQVIGALALLEGRMAEMATGEGKTITAAMAAIVAAWRGKPCHVVTANDYLAKRDAELGQRLFGFCQVSAASVDGEMAPQIRAAAYGHDIVYSTAKELLGDYLRDRLALGKGASRTRLALEAARSRGGQGELEGVVMRGMVQVIVDEADSVLIDEAVTPLIISSQHPDDFLDQAARDAVHLANQLHEGEDYTLQRALRHVSLTLAGQARLVALAADLAPFWRHRDRARELVEMALYATRFLIRDQHYVVDDDKVVLVDELTGRLARQHTLSLGMQQILEASQNLPLSPPSEVSARLSFQRFFRLFIRLGGMTGTAEEARHEFGRVYRLLTVKIPTHKPVRRAHWQVVVCRNQIEKYTAIAKSALSLIVAGRAILIGMRSVGASEELYRHMRAVLPRVDIQILHAVNHDQESAIVARAGQPGALTIATNMAGRGTDIALHPSVRDRGGLHVIIGESNDFSRIDRQLLGRSARQGDPGSVQRFFSMDEDLIRRFLAPWLKKVWQWQHDHLPSWDPWVSGLVLRHVQWRAERLAFRQRSSILEQDMALDRGGF
ncbi:MAG: hypothetical protein HQL77_06900 [Magnetococcales bacterium]|nr:hypothetical protein [Magnetococcales bacterium]